MIYLFLELYDGICMTSRFLRFNSEENCWEEIGALAARDKVGHALRFASNEKLKKKKRGQGHRRLGSDFSNSSELTGSSFSSEASNTSFCVQPLAHQSGQSIGGQDLAMGSLMQALLSSMNINAAKQMQQHQQQVQSQQMQQQFQQIQQQTQHLPIQPPLHIPPQLPQQQQFVPQACSKVEMSSTIDRSTIYPPLQLQTQSQQPQVRSQPNAQVLSSGIHFPHQGPVVMHKQMTAKECRQVSNASCEAVAPPSATPAITKEEAIVDGNMMSMLNEPIYEWDVKPHEL